MIESHSYLNNKGVYNFFRSFYILKKCTPYCDSEH